MNKRNKSKTVSFDSPVVKTIYQRRSNEINPLTFDCPPPIFSDTNDKGWCLLAKSIICKETELIKLIKHARVYHQKQEDLCLFPFYDQVKEPSIRYQSSNYMKLMTQNFTNRFKINDLLQSKGIKSKQTVISANDESLFKHKENKLNEDLVINTIEKDSFKNKKQEAAKINFIDQLLENIANQNSSQNSSKQKFRANQLSNSTDRKRLNYSK